MLATIDYRVVVGMANMQYALHGKRLIMQGPHCNVGTLSTNPSPLLYTPSPPASCCVHITIQFSFVRQSFCVYMKIVFVVFFLFCFLLFLVLFFQHFHCTFLQPNKFFDKQLTEIDKRTSNGPANVWRAHTRQTERERDGAQLTVCLSLQLIDRSQSQSQSRQSDRKQNRLLCLPAPCER